MDSKKNKYLHKYTNNLQSENQTSSPNSSIDGSILDDTINKVKFSVTSNLVTPLDEEILQLREKNKLKFETLFNQNIGDLHIKDQHSTKNDSINVNQFSYDENEPKTSIMNEGKNIKNILNTDFSSNNFPNNNFRILPKCYQLFSHLNQQGHATVQLIPSDVNERNMTLSVFVVETWAESILQAIMEMEDRLLTQQKAVRDVSYSFRGKDLNNESLYSKMEDMQNKLMESERREKGYKAQIKQLEEVSEHKDKMNKTLENDAKKMFKNLEMKVQEAERRIRQKEIETEKLKEKLRSVVEKEKEVSQRNRSILSKVKQGDMSFIMNDSLNNSDLSYRSNSLENHEQDRKIKSNLSTPSKSPYIYSKRRNSNDNTNENLNQINQTPITPSKTLISTAKSSPHNNVSFSSSNGSDNAMLNMINAYENQKNELLNKNNELEQKVEELITILKQIEYSTFGNNKSNHKLSEKRDTVDIISTASTTPIASKMYETMQQQQQKIVILEEELADFTDNQKKSDELINQYISKIHELQNKIDNLELEVKSRPSVKKFNQLQHDYDELEHKLYDLITKKNEIAELNLWKKKLSSNQNQSNSFKNNLSTQEQIRIDKKNHELGLYIIDSLPRMTMRDILLSICRELDISDVSEIIFCIIKLKSCVKTIPKMNNFIMEICLYIDSREEKLQEMERMKYHQNGFYHQQDNRSLSLFNQLQIPYENNEKIIGEDKAQVVMENVLPRLKRWWERIQRCHRSDHFMQMLHNELLRRDDCIIAQKQNNHDNTNQDGYEDESNRSTLRLFNWLTHEPQKIIKIIRDAVDVEVELLHHRDTCPTVTQFVQAHPEHISSGILRHVMYLFDLKSPDAILPFLNRIYLDMEEYHNFVKLMRSIIFNELPQNNLGNGNKRTNHSHITDTMLLGEVQRIISTAILNMRQ
eukprot:gene8400-11358_t